MPQDEQVQLARGIFFPCRLFFIFTRALTSKYVEMILIGVLENLLHWVTLSEFLSSEWLDSA